VLGILILSLQDIAILTLANGVYILYRDQKERLENSAENIGKEINISIADWIDA
jgi:hypothetical protein